MSSRATPPQSDVKIQGRIVQLELGPDDRSKESNPFYFSVWTWRLMVRRDAMSTFVVQLSTLPSYWMDLEASITLKFICFSKKQNKPLTVHYPSAINAPLGSSFTWTVVACGAPGRCLAKITFGTIKFISPFVRGQPIWPMEHMIVCSRTCATSGTRRMLRDGILTDITVNAVGGSVSAHRAVLGACSPVFLSMFSHDLREKARSAVDIPDMSIDGCRVFVGFLYGDTSEEDLIAHRDELVAAGDKYGVESLKSACERSMIDDVDAGNVLERLQTAHLYRLRELKRVCVRLLVEFGMIYEISEDFDAFMQAADRDLVAEMEERCRHVMRQQPKRKSSSPTLHQDKAAQASGHGDGDGARAKRARRPNVRLAGGEWAK